MKKYKVTQEFMDALNKWNENHKYPDGTTLINQHTLNDLPEDVTEWLFEILTIAAEKNNRLGALINWINGEDVFKVSEPSYIVQRKEVVSPAGREYLHIYRDGSLQFVYSNRLATKFDDYMKAHEWAGIHFEVVGLDE